VGQRLPAGQALQQPELVAAWVRPERARPRALPLAAPLGRTLLTPVRLPEKRYGQSDFVVLALPSSFLFSNSQRRGLLGKRPQEPSGKDS